MWVTLYTFLLLYWCMCLLKLPQIKDFCGIADQVQDKKKSGILQSANLNA